jgi:Xaa-Pro aminopeptidase
MINALQCQKIFSQLKKSNPDMDGIYIQKPENIFWLSGFSGSFGRILLGKKKTFLVSDSRYSGTIQQLLAKNPENIFEYREFSGGGKNKNFWKDLEKEAEISILAFESHSCTHQGFENLQKNFSSSLHPAKEVIEKLRETKSPKEIAHIQKAATIADKTLMEVVKHFAEGVSEKELAWVFEEYARKNCGAQSLSFDTIVAFAENSAIAHHSPSEKKLTKNSAILIDCGVKYKGYCSDMTRCFWFGEQNTPEFMEWKKRYIQVKTAQEKGIEKMQAGVKITEAEKSARKFLGDDKKFFTHSFGHGVGLEIHENPHVSSRAKNEKEVFQENMIVTAEPGLYFPHKFGIRIEDLLCISKTGEAKKLSNFPYFFDDILLS